MGRHRLVAYTERTDGLGVQRTTGPGSQSSTMRPITLWILQNVL